MAQLARCLQHKHEGLDLDPQHPCEEPGVGIHICTLGTERETIGSQRFASQPG